MRATVVDGTNAIAVPEDGDPTAGAADRDHAARLDLGETLDADGITGNRGGGRG
jgi:hypothetical protein